MRIYVVEDEQLALDDLLTMLQPFAVEHELLGFTSANEALAHANAAPPDLLITDIRMPGMNGLELLQQLRAQQPTLGAAIVSGFRDFEYARTGLRLGVTDYLLKPVRTEALCEAVARVLEAVATERAAHARLRLGQITEQLLGVTSAADELPLTGEYGVVLLVCENWASPVGWKHTAITPTWLLQLLAGGGLSHSLIVDLDSQRRVVLLPQPCGPLKLVHQTALHIQKAILGAGVMVHIVYGLRLENEPLEQTIQRALRRLREVMLLAAPTFASLDGEAEHTTEGMSNERRQITIRALEQRNLIAAVQEVSAVMSQLQRSNAPQQRMIAALAELFSLIQPAVQGGAVRLPQREQIALAVESSRDLQSLLVWAEAVLRPVLAVAQGAATPRQLVGSLVALVQTSYAEDLSLQAFAATHNVSLAYFSRLFKEEMGKTFSEYLMQIRIERAQGLLATTTLRLADVSTLIGYDDPKYFSQLFRRVVGIGPLEYQQQHSRAAPVLPPQSLGEAEAR